MAKFSLDDISFLFKFTKYIEREISLKLERTLGRWKPRAIELLKREINNSLDRGYSPVEGGGHSTGGGRRFKAYSQVYKEKIREGKYTQFAKRETPVNLKLSGKMRRSLRGRPTIKGIALFYTDPKISTRYGSLSDIHNKHGAGKSKVVRQILPVGNQQFARPIDTKLTALYTKLFNMER